MTSDTTTAIAALLDRAKEAHGEYEQTERYGVYDEGWPGWYAEYVVREGLGSLLGRDVTAAEVAIFFTTAWDEFKVTGAEATETWTLYTARRMVEELSAPG